MKKLLSILLVLVITGSISSTNIVSATTSTAAQSLYQLGLLSNISENEMDMPLNRIVGLTMQLKSIGYKDNDALISQKSHAFTDFTGSYAWGSGWANIGVSNHITAGTSTTKYSPDKIMTKKEFVVGELRVLGYGLEESWSNCAELAIQAGLIHTANDLIDLRFTKSDAAEIMYAALSANIKDSEDLTLIEYLVRDGVVNEEAAKKLKFPSLKDRKSVV